MNRKRMEHLLEVMEGVQRARKPFNLNYWMKSELGGREETSGRTDACGTACCAFGYAALDPKFQAEGLKMEVDVGFEIRPVQSIAEFNALVKKHPDEGACATPIFNGNEGYSAARAFFGLSLGAVEFMFDPDTYNVEKITPSMVIKRIRAVIANKGEVPA